MSGSARLVSLRLQGFKSFAERTLIEFGPGINAVVGPNGSGKSNLADALRWALGEQGRALRSRRSEDVIFAGSERRSAVGMADVAVVLDNADGLLPVDFATVELGRRLYRSGENDYLLNRQRVRLRDLVDLLDGARLAENAFLFIGQGMVDQALALRPEERRPLFEEVAGVRRHDRRRRRAEEQLLEAEANLGRVEDLLAELRPQARRLAAQAEQQSSRERAAEALGQAVLAATHARWHETAARGREAESRLQRARAAADQAMSALRASEDAAAVVARELTRRAEPTRDRTAAHEAARSSVTDLQVRMAGLGAELAATARERARLDEERRAIEAGLASRRRELSLPVPERDAAPEQELAQLERALAEAGAETASLQAAHLAHDAERAAIERAGQARRTEIERARRQEDEAAARAAAERAEADEAQRRAAGLAGRLAATEAARLAAESAERTATAGRESARREVESLERQWRTAADREAEAGARAAATRGRLEELERRLSAGEGRALARAARRAGGRLLAEGLEIEPSLRAAAAAALGIALGGFVVARGAAAELAVSHGTEQGVIVVEPAGGSSRGRGDDASGRIAPAEAAAAVGAATELGGGRLTDAVRGDPSGVAGRLLARAVWVPDAGSAVRLQATLPAGWVVASRDGTLVSAAGLVTLGGGDSVLRERAELADARADAEAAAREAGIATGASQAAVAALGAGGQVLDEARGAETAAVAERRRAEAEEAAVSREAERAARESAWHAAQATHLEAEHETLKQALEAALVAAGMGRPASPAEQALGPSADAGPALETWERRFAELVARRETLAGQLAESDRRRQEAAAHRARAQAAADLDEERLGRADREAAGLVERAARLEVEAAEVGGALETARSTEERTRAALDELHSQDARDRERLAQAEEASGHARQALRQAEERLRPAEIADLEARLALDGVREQVLVELAGLGALGVRLVRDAAQLERGEVGHAGEEADATDEGAALEAALPGLGQRWASTPPPPDTPGPVRVAALRRRYHELGAANPFAVEEFAALRARLESLEAQESDLRAAIDRTRALIGELETLIANQFRATFRALEGAFETRFRQLFGGGYAQLSLTEPGDLAATGVEIVARPPGKRTQPLGMLSGGERALTAVALLFAMLEVRPVPFCVLDEVDAALDEANVGRFSEALVELAAATQFVVITHNRGTIEAANALYGVTIGDDAVSRVVSLRLDEAQNLADAARAS